MLDDRLRQTCRYCGKKLDSYREWQRFCSQEHKDRWYKKLKELGLTFLHNSTVKYMIELECHDETENTVYHTET